MEVSGVQPIGILCGIRGGLKYRHDMVRESDVILYVGAGLGSVTTQKWTLPANGEKTLIHLDVDPHKIGRNYQTDAAVVADAKLGLAAIVDSVADELGGQPAGKIDPLEMEQRRGAFMESVDEFSSAEIPIRPERFVTELNRVLLPDVKNDVHGRRIHSSNLTQVPTDVRQILLHQELEADHLLLAVDKLEELLDEDRQRQGRVRPADRLVNLTDAAHTDLVPVHEGRLQMAKALQRARQR